jgi:hypothetical protein
LTRAHLLSCLVVLVVVAGCNPAATDDDGTPPKPKPVTFQGAIDNSFVGQWKTAKNTSGLDLRKDGTVTISSEIPTPKGIVKSKFEGKWLVSSGDLLLQYAAPKQAETTIKYPAKLSGSQMTLDQGSRSKMVYSKK